MGIISLNFLIKLATEVQAVLTCVVPDWFCCVPCCLLPLLPQGSRSSPTSWYVNPTSSWNFWCITIDVVTVLPRNSTKNIADSTGTCVNTCAEVKNVCDMELHSSIQGQIYLYIINVSDFVTKSTPSFGIWLITLSEPQYKIFNTSTLLQRPLLPQKHAVNIYSVLYEKQ